MKRVARSDDGDLHVEQAATRVDARYEGSTLRAVVVDAHYRVGDVADDGEVETESYHEAQLRFDVDAGGDARLVEVTPTRPDGEGNAVALAGCSLDAMQCVAIAEQAVAAVPEVESVESVEDTIQGVVSTARHWRERGDSGGGGA